MIRTIIAAVFLSTSFLNSFAADGLRIGIIGLDTSHVVAFTRLINDPNHADHVSGGKVVAAFKGGSQDVESSRTRVDRFTKQLQDEFGVKIVSSIESLCEQVDAILLESVDGRPHLEQARPVIAKGIPLFIDKPVAGSLKDALEIYRLAKEKGVPIFSSSSYRFYPSLTELAESNIGEIRAAISYGPCHLEAHHPDLYWYGVHPTEALFTILGTGCQQVSRVSTTDTDIVTGLWTKGRTGALYGLRTKSTPHKVIAFGANGVAEQGSGGGYAPLVEQIMTFFKTGNPPVSLSETIEIFAFMEAADESKRRGGAPVKIDELIRAHGGSWFLEN
jgi:hypothetical protein